MASPYGSFQLEGTHLHFLHTIEAKHKPSVGWVTGGEDFNREVTVDEDCLVTNLQDLGLDDEVVDIKARPIDDLWRAQKEPEEEDDGFGVPGMEVKKKKKNVIVKQQTMNFNLKMKMSGDACTSKTLNCAPVIHYEKRKPYTFKNYSVELERSQETSVPLTICVIATQKKVLLSNIFKNGAFGAKPAQLSTICLLFNDQVLKANFRGHVWL